MTDNVNIRLGTPGEKQSNKAQTTKNRNISVFQRVKSTKRAKLCMNK